jgi:hypothetical protein
MRTQARGLAQAVADTVEERTVRLAAPWRWLPPRLVPHPLERQQAGSDRLAPPWPDLLVTCGRRSVPFSLAIRKASAGKTITVHIQDPLRSAADFDLVVALAHDPIAPAPNVLKTITAMHDVTAARLAAAADRWEERLAPLGRPLLGVAIGGPTRRSRFTLSDARALASSLLEKRRAGFGLAITPSRRTPKAVRRLLEETFAGDAGVFLWDLEGENPYFAILARADRLVVTGDSVSMVSEAIATGAPVEVFDLGQGRHELFLDTLVEGGLATRLGDPAPGQPREGGYDATTEAAASVKRLLQLRL